MKYLLGIIILFSPLVAAKKPEEKNLQVFTYGGSIYLPYVDKMQEYASQFIDVKRDYSSIPVAGFGIRSRGGIENSFEIAKYGYGYLGKYSLMKLFGSQNGSFEDGFYCSLGGSLYGMTIYDYAIPLPIFSANGMVGYQYGQLFVDLSANMVCSSFTSTIAVPYPSLRVGVTF